MENEIYQILRKHKLPLKKREEVLTDLLLLFNVSNCGGGIPYDSLSDSFKKSIDSIEDNLNS